MKKFTKKKFKAVVIGVSAGGFEALHAILPLLRPSFKLPIVVVQHQHPHANNFLAISLDKQCHIKVKQVDEKEVIVPGVVYIAPANYHLLIEEDYSFSLSTWERINYARPSIDLLFECAADVYGEQLLGIILTGANSDGCQGCKSIQERGGLVLVQDPATANMDSMPKAALKAIQNDDCVFSLTEIADFLNQIGCEEHVAK